MSMLVMCDTVYIRKRETFTGSNSSFAMLCLEFMWNIWFYLLFWNPKKHLPYQCEFGDNGIISSYAKGVYNYYDVQQIEEFVAFKGASLIEKYDATLYKSESFAILEYCYDNYTSNAYVKPYIEKFFAVQEETNILQEAM